MAYPQPIASVKMDPSRQSLEMQESVALGDDVEGTSQPEPKLTTLKRFISKVRLDASTLILMFKSVNTSFSRNFLC